LYPAVVSTSRASRTTWPGTRRSSTWGRRPYLIRGGGEGIAIDGFVEASSDDRSLAVVRGGVLVLIDDVSGREQVLPALACMTRQRSYTRSRRSART
jgi:hypothetical protein